MRKMVAVIGVAVLALMLGGGTVLAAGSAGNASVGKGTAATTDQAWIGISVVPITDRVAQRLNLNQKDGVVVAAVAPDGPAAKTDLKRGDVVTAVNGVAVKTAADVRTEVRKAKPGDTVTLNTIRGGNALTVQIMAATYPQRSGAQPAFEDNYGSTHSYKDADGNVVTVYSIPGVVTAISATSITITPNNAQARGGPFAIDGNTRIVAGKGKTAASDIKVDDKVTVAIVGDSTTAKSIAKAGAADLKSRLMNGLRNGQLLQQFRNAAPGRLRNRQAPAIPGVGA
jgi:membrane-associated protease RseP (regulator of RpoE activity)